MRHHLVSAALLVAVAVPAQAQFRVGVQTFPTAPPVIRGYSPPVPVLTAPVARQSALPLVAPPVSPILGRNLVPAFWGGGFYGGSYSYYPPPNYSYSNTNININNYNGVLPEPYPLRYYSSLPVVIPAHPATAWLTLEAPLGAEVYLQGKRIEMGASRKFESPELAAGQSYTFDVRVVWQENGKTEERTRTLAVKAGEHQSINYFGQADPPIRAQK